MKKRLLKYGEYALLFFCIVGITIYIYKYNIVFIDSDTSSELVLAKLLNKSGSIMSSDWYYSTELRFINSNLVFAPLFSFFNNWSIVRSVGTGICMLLLVLSFLHLCSQLEIKNRYILCCLLVLPISIQYFGMYIAHPFYSFSTIKSLLTIVLLISVIKKSNKLSLKLVLLSILSFIQGSEGMRNMVLTIVPIIFTYLILEMLLYFGVLDNNYIDTIKKMRKAILCVAVFSVAGYLFYVFVLTQTYSFMSFNDMSFKLLDGDFLTSIINGFLKTFGYTEGMVLSSVLFHNGLSLLLLLLTIIVIISNIKNINNNNKETCIFTIITSVTIGMLIMCFSFLHFIDGDMVRYNLPLVFITLPLVFSWLEKKSNALKIFKFIYIALILLYVLCGVDNLNSYRKYDKNILNQINMGRVENNNYDLKEITDMLLTNGYKNGYSYFWHGNILTELSNGQIDMRVFANGGYSTPVLENLDDLQKWLQSKEHFKTKPTGKVFVLFNMEEYEKSRVSERLEWGNVIYNNPDYVVYGYESYNNLIDDFNNN